MSFDLSQFHSLFFEEADEQLAALEDLLVRVGPRQTAGEEVAELFRRAHSIKGAAATFGFDDMAALGHDLEDLLDPVRKGRLAFDGARIDACRTAVGTLRRQLAEHRGGAPTAGGSRASATGRLEPRPAPAADAVPGVADVELRFVVGRLVAGSEVLVDTTLEELAALGELVAVDRPAPGAREWRVRIHTASSEAALRGVLDLLVEPGSLRIEPGGDPASGRAAEGPAVAEEAEDGSWGFFEPVPPAAPVPPRDWEPEPVPAGIGEIDRMAYLVDELAALRSSLEAAVGAREPAGNENLVRGLARLARLTRALREAVAAIRGMPGRAGAVTTGPTSGGALAQGEGSAGGRTERAEACGDPSGVHDFTPAPTPSVGMPDMLSPADAKSAKISPPRPARRGGRPLPKVQCRAGSRYGLQNEWEEL